MTVTYEINLVNLVQKFNSEEKCRAYLEALRWPDGVRCPRCQHESVSRLEDRNQYECNECRYQFSVTSGTIMHDTHLPLWKWFLAVYMIVESKKSVSANQIKRMIEVSYKTAWYLCHRIREALMQPHALLTGIVEIDESFLGTKKDGTLKDAPSLLGAVERGGRAVIKKHRGYPDARVLRSFLREVLCTDGVEAIYSDDNKAYGDLSRRFKQHCKVLHGKEQWAVGDVHTNTIESIWGLFKRSIIGSFHKISEKHLDRYIDEFEFRFNNRNNPFIFRDAIRELLTCGNLEYKELVRSA